MQTFISAPRSIKQELESMSMQNKQQINFTLSDMYALKLDTLEWIKIQIPGESKLARTNHCLAKIEEDALILFGGNGSNSMYSNKDYLIIFSNKKV